MYKKLEDAAHDIDEKLGTEFVKDITHHRKIIDKFRTTRAKKKSFLIEGFPPKRTITNDNAKKNVFGWGAQTPQIPRFTDFQIPTIWGIWP